MNTFKKLLLAVVFSFTLYNLQAMDDQKKDKSDYIWDLKSSISEHYDDNNPAPIDLEHVRQFSDDYKPVESGVQGHLAYRCENETSGRVKHKSVYIYQFNPQGALISSIKQEYDQVMVNAPENRTQAPQEKNQHSFGSFMRSKFFWGSILAALACYSIKKIIETKKITQK